MLSSEPGSPARHFFGHLAGAGQDAFDLFSVHLYGDPGAVPGYLDTARQLMRDHGYLKPVVVGEHGGPEPFEFPDAMAVLQQVLASAFAQAPPTQSTGELAERAGQENPERRAMAALYDRMGDLPPALQMFMAGCPPELEARRHRISCRQLVARTLLALAGGVRRTAYWNLAPEYPGPVDHQQVMHLLIGKLPLLGYRDGTLGCRHPAADTFALLARQLAGAQAVTRQEAGGPPTLHAVTVDRPGRGPLLVLWDQRDAFHGEDEPPVIVTWPWPAATAAVTDAFGQARTVRSQDSQLRLPVSVTPLFITEEPVPQAPGRPPSSLVTGTSGLPKSSCPAARMPSSTSAGIGVTRNAVRAAIAPAVVVSMPGRRSSAPFRRPPIFCRHPATRRPAKGPAPSPAGAIGRPRAARQGTRGHVSAPAGATLTAAGRAAAFPAVLM
ncbi:MAG TPA: hypothetical protein VK586_12235 [Streptosporangiaceae bacterium]|nr:hypothetical protein [Streptosporangiaceae bacterium]